MVKDAVFYTPHAVLAYISKHGGRIRMSQIEKIGVPSFELITMVNDGYLTAIKEFRVVDLDDVRTFIEPFVCVLTEKGRTELSDPESKLPMRLIAIVPPSTDDLDKLLCPNKK